VYGASLPSTLTTGSDGRLQYRVRDAAVETVTLTSKLASSNIAGGDGSPANLAFNSQNPCLAGPPACPAPTELWADPRGSLTTVVEAAGDVAHVQKVYVKAISLGGLPLANQTVEWILTDADGNPTTNLVVPAGGVEETSTGADGIAEIWLATTTAGTYKVGAKISNASMAAVELGEANKVAPQTVPVEIKYGAGAIDASKSAFDVVSREGLASANPQVSDATGAPAAGDEDWWIVRVKAQDAQGNPVSVPVDDPSFNLAFSGIASQNSGLAFSPIQLVAAGTVLPGETTPSTAPAYIAYARTTKAGSWSLRALAGGAEVNGSPAVRTWEVGDVDPAMSEYTLPNAANVTADGNSPQTATITVKDSFGNPIPGKLVKIEETPADPDSKLAVEPSLEGATSNDAGKVGQFAFQLKSTQAKTYQIKAYVRNEADTDWVAVPAAKSAQGNPAPATFVAGACSAANSVLEVDKATATVGEQPGTAATKITATIRTLDATGNACTPTALPQLQVESGASGVTGAVTGTNGVYTAAVTDKAAESFDLSASIDGVGVGKAKIGSAQVVAAESVELTFTEDAPSFEFCTDAAGHTRKASNIAIDTPADALTGVGEHAVTAEIVDKYCNPIKGAEIAFSYAAPLTFKSGAPASKKTDADGKYREVVTSNLPSTAATDFEVTGKVSVGSISAQPITNDNDARNGSESDGKVYAKFGTSGVDPEQSDWAVDPAGPLKADGAQAYTVTVHLVDTNGQVVPASANAIALTVSPAAGVTVGAFAETAGTPGEYKATITATKAGSKAISVSAGGAIAPASASRAFEATDPVKANSSFEVTNADKTANNSDTQTATLTVRDANDNPVEGVACDFSYAPAAGTAAIAAPYTLTLDKPSPAATDADGKCQASVKTNQAGTYAISASYTSGSTTEDFGPLNTSFKAGPESTTASTLTLSPTSQTVGGAISAIATITDANGNPKSGVTVYFRVGAGLGDASHTAIVGAPTQVTNALGVATVTVTSTKADAYPVFAALGGQDGSGGASISGSPANAVFTAGPVSLVRSSLAVDSATYIAADREGEHTVTATLLDQYDNPVAGQSVDFALDPSLTLKPGQANPAQTDGSGKASIIVTADYEADVAVHPASWTGTPPQASLPVTAAYGGQAVGNGVNANFRVGGAQAAASTLTLERCTNALCGVEAHNPPTVDDKPAYQAKVLVKNAAGQVVPGASVVFTLDNGALFSNNTNTITVAAGDDGRATATLYSEKLAAGSETTLRATIGGVEVGSSPQHPTFGVGKPFNGQSAANGDPASRVAITSGTVTADGVAAHTATVYAVDKFGNLVPGAKVKLTPVVSQSDLTPVADAVAITPETASPNETDGSGKTTYTVTSTKAGTYWLHAEVVKDQAIASPGSADYQPAYSSPVSAAFGAGAADPANSQFTLAPVSSSGVPPLQVGDGDENKYLAKVRTLDAQGNIVAGASVVFTVAGQTASDDASEINLGGAKQVSVTAISGPDGYAQAVIYSKKPGTFTVKAEIGAVGVSGSPKQASWKTGDPAVNPPVVCNPPLGNGDGLPSTNLRVEPADAVPADGQATHAVTITVRDQYCNPILGQAVTWSPDSHLTLKDAAQTTTDADGQATVEYASTSASDAGWTVGATVTGFGTLGAANLAPAHLKYKLGALSLDKSEITAPASVQVGKSGDVTVTLKDEFGHVLPCGEHVTLAKAAGGSLDAAKYAVTTGELACADGVYSGQITAAESGSGQVTFAANGQTAPADAAHVKTVQFAVGTVDAGKSTFAVTPTGAQSVDGGEFTGTVKAVDANGDPVQFAEIAFTIPADLTGATPLESATGLDVAARTDADGLASVTYTAAIAKAYTVAAKAGGDQIGSDKTITFTAGAWSAANSKIAITPASQEVNGTGAVKVELYDAHGNKITATQQVTLYGHDGADLLPADGYTLSANATKQSDGSYKGAIKGLAVGDAVVYYAVNGEPTDPEGAQGAEWAKIHFDINADMDAAKSSFSVDPASGSKLADGEESFTGTAVIKNAAGNGIPGVTVTFPVSAGLAFACAADCKTDANGAVSGTYTSTKAGQYTVWAEVNGVKAGASGQTDKSVKFAAGPASAAHSKIAANPTTQRINVEVPVTVYLFDAFDNPVTDCAASVKLVGKSGSDKLAPSAYTLSSDLTQTTAGYGAPAVTTCAYEGTVTGGRAGQAVIGFTLNGASGGDTAEVAFTFDGTPDMAKSGYVVDSADAPADGKTARNGVATIKNQYGEPIPG
ncbi:MAG: Ig-like domain-containing protein, partial [Propionibacteriaceae bacterium]|nr:Ig-like domain-containing protein [Propionibacteriaceae bacterium]